MREIKFRAWNITEKRFLTTEELIYRVGAEAKRQFILANNFLSFGKSDPSDEIIFQQYTGLKDKNGQEIYEGDIVEWQYKDNKERFTITYWEEDAMFLGKKDPDRHGGAERNWSYSKVVVGNIFEGVDKGINNMTDYVKIIAVLEEVADMEINLGSKEGRKFLAQKIMGAIDTPLSRDLFIKSYKDLTNE